MIASVWVHVGCLPQIHKQSCQQQERIVNTKVCKVNTCTSCVCTTSHGNASRTCVRHHCMVVCVCLYLYDCMCMIDVWLYDNVRMMSWWQTQDHIQLVAACHPTWLRLYQFMLVEIPGEVLEGSDVDTLLGPGGFRCRYLLRFRKVPVQTPGFWRVPVQIPVEVPGLGSFTIVQHHCACMCMIVSVWLYVYDCMTMCAWCHREGHTTTRVSNSVQSNMTAYVWVHLFDDNDARSHGGVF